MPAPKLKTKVARKALPRQKPAAGAAEVDAYIATFPVTVQSTLQKIRRTIKQAAPAAQERVSYKIPAFFGDGVLVYYAAFKKHIGFYPPVRGDERLERAVAKYAGPKGNLQFPLDQPIPYKLIARIVKHKLKLQKQKSPPRRKKV